MILMELSLMGLGLWFLMTNLDRRALTFGTASLFFLFALFLGSIALAVFGMVSLGFGIATHRLPQSRRSHAITATAIALVLTGIVAVQHIGQVDRAPVRPTPQQLFSNNLFSLPASLGHYRDRIKTSDALGKLSIKVSEPNSRSRLQPLRSLAKQGFPSNPLVTTTSADLQKLIHRPLTSSTLVDLQQFVKAKGLQIEAKAAGVQFTGLIQTVGGDDSDHSIQFLGKVSADDRPDAS